jgi:hypothetical protein
MWGFRDRTTGLWTGVVKRGVGECSTRACQRNGTGEGNPYSRLGDFLNYRTPHV